MGIKVGDTVLVTRTASGVEFPWTGVPGLLAEVVFIDRRGVWHERGLPVMLRCPPTKWNRFYWTAADEAAAFGEVPNRRVAELRARGGAFQWVPEDAVQVVERKDN